MTAAAVQLENEITFETDRDRVWELMTDVPRVVPCIPGGRLLETIDDSNWKAEVALDLGFTRVVFLADVSRRELDPGASRAILEINATDSKGKSSAHAELTSTLTAKGDATDVQVVTDISMEGEVARFGAGIIEDVSYEIVDQMAKCLQARLAEPGLAAGAGSPPEASANKLSLWGAFMLWFRGRRRRRARSKS